MQDMIITGFGAFPGVKHNPATAVALALGRDRCWRRQQRQVSCEILPVGYAEVARRLAEMAAAPPRALLMFGVAARRKAVTPEARAINRVSRSQPDAMRQMSSRGILEPGAMAFRTARTDLRRLVMAARGAGCQTWSSGSAGRYVCNAAFWHGLRLMPRHVDVAFIHIPMPRKPGTLKSRAGAASPSAKEIHRAGRAIAHAMLARARRRA